MAKAKAKVDLSADLKAAAEEYEAAYRDCAGATKMNVPTPEGVGTFGGVWDCDRSRLLRALVLAIRRTRGVCSGAAERASRGEEVRLAEADYGDALGAGPGADVYRMPNGALRDLDGRYLTSAESGIITLALRGRSLTAPVVAGDEWDRYRAAGRLAQEWIDGQAGDDVARTLTGSYTVGWPVCTDRQKLDAYRRVRDIYRTLASAYRDAE